MKDLINNKIVTFGLLALMSIVMLTACSSDNGDGDQKPPIPKHVVDPSISTLITVIDEESKDYTPTEFREAIVKWPLLSFGGDAIATLIRPALRLSVSKRIPQMDALFKEKVGTAADGSRQWNVKRRVFTYKSISAVTGNDTTLVGSVIHGWHLSQ